MNRPAEGPTVVPYGFRFGRAVLMCGCGLRVEYETCAAADEAREVHEREHADRGLLHGGDGPDGAPEGL